MMSIWEAIVLGLVQGVTEFLPVSSSAHLILARKLMGIEDSQVVLFNILLHCGSLVAIFAAFRKDLMRLALAFCGICMDGAANVRIRFSGKREKRYRNPFATSSRRMVVLLFITTVPTALIGALMYDLVETASCNLLAPGVGLYITAILLLVAHMMPEGEVHSRQMKGRDAFLAGCFQGFSVFPGISRLGTTMTACVLGGMSRSFAVRYSILAAVPAILGALISELLHMGGEGGFSLCFLPGIAASAAAGYFAIRVMLRIVRKHRLLLFAAYCGIMGTVQIAAYFGLA